MIPSKTPEDNSSRPDTLGNVREPLLSDERLKARSQYRGPMTAAEVRDFYEGLITSGELRVVSRVIPTRTYEDGRWWDYHKCCGRKFSDPFQDGEFCKCGAMITS